MADQEQDDVFNEFYGSGYAGKFLFGGPARVITNDNGIVNTSVIIRGRSPPPVPLALPAPQMRLEKLAAEVAALKLEVERQRAEIERVYLCPLCRAGNKVE
jgi:hypothetical protein